MIVTPPLSAGALEGITQNSVMTIARDLGFECRIGELTRSDLYICDEMFVCWHGGGGERGERGR